MAGHELIETPRLRLRRPRLADAAAIFARYASDPEVVKYVGFPCHLRLADTEAFIRYCDAEWARVPAGPLLAWSRADGRLLGGTGLALESGGVVSTGYVLAKDAWGHGYATESLRAMIDLAKSLSVPRLIARVHPEHRPSARVLEKCGFTLDSDVEATYFPNLSPGVLIDALRYSRDLGA
ncbi:MAG TPA: GNAT family N-acetyltransferase [Vicinamibacterales bacterium]|nr:GNAT family N-acetyltransferase [Vicinamibacterales bacterium]